MLLSAPEARRGAHGKKRLELIGEVAGSDVIIVDDIIDSGNTVRELLSGAIIPAAQSARRNSLTRPARLSRRALCRSAARTRCSSAAPVTSSRLRRTASSRRRPDVIAASGVERVVVSNSVRRRPPPAHLAAHSVSPPPRPRLSGSAERAARPSDPAEAGRAVGGPNARPSHRRARGAAAARRGPEAPTFALTGVARSRSAEERASSRASRGASQPASRQASSGAPPTPTTAQRSVNT